MESLPNDLLSDIFCRLKTTRDVAALTMTCTRLREVRKERKILRQIVIPNCVPRGTVPPENREAVDRALADLPFPPGEARCAIYCIQCRAMFQVPLEAIWAVHLCPHPMWAGAHIGPWYEQAIQDTIAMGVVTSEEAVAKTKARQGKRTHKETCEQVIAFLGAARLPRLHPCDEDYIKGDHGLSYDKDLHWPACYPKNSEHVRKYAEFLHLIDEERCN